MNDARNALGELINEKRLAKGLTLDQLAERIRLRGHHVINQTISAWETGQSIPRPKYLREIALVLRIPLAVIAAKAADATKERRAELAERRRKAA